MNRKIKVNLHQFSEDELTNTYVGENGELDMDRLLADYAEETPDEDEESVKQTTENFEEDNPEDELEKLPEDDPEDEPEEKPEEEEKEQKKLPDRAFADMRKQVEQYKPLAEFVQSIAASQGFENPQELIDAYNQQRLVKEAQEKGVPEDVYLRMHELENKLSTTEEVIQSERFDKEVTEVRSKYNLDNEDVDKVIDFMVERKYGIGDIPFEDAYILANRDSLLQNAEEKGRQNYLEEKRKKQKNAVKDVGTGAADGKGQGLDMSKEAIFKTLNDYDIDI